LKTNLPKKIKRSSDILKDIAEDHKADHVVTYRYIVKMLGERTFGLVLLLFALPSILPLSSIPGVSFIFSLPIALCSFQLIIGRNTLWIPEVIANQTIEHQKLAKIIQKTLPFLKKMERFLSPRCSFMFYWGIERLSGLIIFILSLLLMLPIPFSNMILSAFIVLFGLGFVEKDGLFVIVGYGGALTYFFLLSFLIAETFLLL